MDTIDKDPNLNMDDLADRFSDPTRPMESNDIMVVGVGGGGGNAVNHMFRQGVENVTFVVCNTDKMAVDNSPVPNKVVIGNGKGAGNRPEVAREFAEKDIDRINNIFKGDAKMVFITAGMGGGTGTGAAPVVARVAREKGLLTIGIVTIPFLFEGKNKILKALDGADEMAKYVDALMIVNNERLTEIYPDLDFFNAFAKADDTLSTAARSISEIITIHGYVNLDFNDVDTTLRDGRTAIIATGYGEGENRVTNALNDALNSPLLKNRDIMGSKRILINIYMARDTEGGKGHSMSMKETSQLRDFIASIDNNVDVIWGATVDNSLGDKVKITILASGFDVTIRDEEEEMLRGEGPEIYKSGAETSTHKPKTGTTRLEEEYGDKANALITSYIILDRDQMDNDDVIDVLERTPTYNRDKRDVDRVKKGDVHTITPEPTESKPSGGNSGKFQINF